MLSFLRSFLRTNKKDIVIVLVIFIVAAVPRVADLGTFLTADEKNWMGRSYEFIRAFKDWRFNDMLQTTHPGVTTMWLTGSAITLKMFASHIPFSFVHLRQFVVASQLPIALLNALAIAGGYVLLRLLFKDRWVPIVASLFIALNPFLIGYSRVAHVDALLASFLLLAALATIIYAHRDFPRRWLVISAVLAALAILTKIPAVFIIPFFGLVVLVKEGRRLWRRPVFGERLRDCILWLLIIALLFVVIWPAMIWVPNQQGNVLVLKRDIGQAALTPHHMVEDYTLNPWHYPAALLTRATPTVQVLVIVVLGWLLLVGWRRGSGRAAGWDLPQWHVVWLLVAYVVFFTVMMTLGAKKGDRYILPVFPALDILAAMGIVVVSRGVYSALAARMVSMRKISLGAVQGTLAGLMIISLGITVLRYHPYAIAYSNPLFPDNLSQELGWGEGLEQVATWLNTHAPNAVVASWYPEELGAYTSARVAHINAHEQGNVEYVVLYRNMFGRASDHPANDFIDEYYTKKDPVFVAHVVGKEFAWVYAKPLFPKTVDELIGDTHFGQIIIPTLDNLLGVDVLVATYQKKAIAGQLIVTLSAADGQRIHQWQVPVKDIQDDRWLSLKLTEPLHLQGQTLHVDITAEGTSVNNAPTIRTNAQGELGIRPRYLVGNQEATEEDTKLLRR